MIPSMFEDQNRNCLINYASSPPIFYLIMKTICLSFFLQGLAYNRRPAQYRCVCEMKDIMKSIVINFIRVICKRIAEALSIQCY